MNFIVDLEIQFATEDAVAVMVKSTAEPGWERFSEGLVFAVYASRFLSNIQRPVADVLSAHLRSAEGNLAELVGVPESKFALVSYPASGAKKRFTGRLTVTDGPIHFRDSVHGFGIMAKGIGYYGPTSVIALLRYLSERRADDVDYLRRLGRTAATVGHLWAGGRISVRSWGEAGQQAVIEAFADQVA